ncbi:MAG: efflux RND transporter permease subunit [Cyanobacterium sp.]
MKSNINNSTQGFSISGVAIRRHIGTIMLTLAVMVIGIFFVNNIAVDLLPSITYPRIGVRVSTNGIAPEVAIEEITRPLEEALSATEGLEQIYSRTREDSVNLDLFFRVGGNIDQALNDATASFNRARGQLPDNLDNIRLFKFDPSQLPVYEFAMTSDSLDVLDLRILAQDEIARELTIVPGVASVDVSGGVNEEVRIEIDLNRLQALGVNLNTVLNELDSANQDITGGRLLGENNEPLTRVAGRFSSAEILDNLSFSSGENGRRVYLREFAQVADGSEEQRVFVTLNGVPAVKVSVQKQPDVNTIEVIENVKQRLEELQRGTVLPDGIEFLPTLDESIFIENAIDNVIMAGLTGAGLAAIAVLLFLGSLRQTFIIVISIPLATLAAIIMMRLSGFSLNVFSLGGLALGVGIVVDNSIVMLETLVGGTEEVTDIPANQRIKKQGFWRNQIIEKSIESASTVESALIASTSTNLVAVLPFLLIGGLLSLLFSELVLTISFAIAASIVVALTIVPMLTSRLLAVPWSSNIRKFFVIRWFNKTFDKINQQYKSTLGFLVNIRWIFVIVIFLGLGGVSFNLAQQLPQEILPSINTGQVNVRVGFPTETTLATNRRVMGLVDEIIQAQPETEYAFTTAGGGLFGANTTENVLSGSSDITLKPGTNVAEFAGRINGEFAQMNLVDIRIRAFPGRVRGLNLNNSPVRADVDVVLQGSDQDTLEQTGSRIINVLDQEATLSDFTPDSDPRQPEVVIRPNPARLADFNLTIQDFTNSLRTSVSGVTPTQLQRGTRLVDINVQLDSDQVRNADDLRNIPIFTNDNRLIRLGEVATIETGEAPSEIRRINQRQVYIITGNLAEGANLGPALDEIDRIIDDIDLPQGIRILPSYARESNDELQSSLPILGGLAGFLVFVVMAVQYNSLIDPLVIMFTLPLALSGGIYGLYFTETPVGATVIVGAILLVGIVVNNAIVMVELANQLYEAQKANPAIAQPSRRDCVIQAASQRLRPIMMTTITTVLGMYPLALGAGDGGEFLQPLGIVVFWGLSLATLLTLFLIPCLYMLLHEPLNFSFVGSNVSSQEDEESVASEETVLT